MSLLRDITASAILIASIVIYQYLLIMIVAPDTQLYELAAGASQVNGSSHAQFWFEIAVLWGPLIGYAVALAFPFTRNYRQSLRAGVR